MVDQAEYGTNRLYYCDIIEFNWSPKHLKATEFRFLYLEKGLSSAEIAKKYGVSKTYILSVLHKMNIRKNAIVRPPDPDVGTKTRNPPIGYEFRNGRLHICKAELRICRQVVNTMRDGATASAAARELVRSGFKNRGGRVSWSHKSVKLIFERWKDKI